VLGDIQFSNDKILEIIVKGDVTILFNIGDAQDVKEVCIIGLEKCLFYVSQMNKFNLNIELDGGKCFIKYTLRNYEVIE
jgi:hypothetical protein